MGPVRQNPIITPNPNPIIALTLNQPLTLTLQSHCRCGNRHLRCGPLRLIDRALICCKTSQNGQPCPKQVRCCWVSSFTRCSQIQLLVFNKFFFRLTSFFSIVDTCLSSEDIARQSCAMVPKWRFFCVLYFQRAVCSTFQTCILNLHSGHTMYGSMVDIQSPTAEIRRGKKEER